MPGKVVGRATTSVKLCQWENRIHAIEQEKKGGCIRRKSESIFKSGAWTYNGPTFRVIGDAQILCFAELYTCWSNGPTYDQVKASLL